MVDYREILRLKYLRYSNTDIAASVHSSRNTVPQVLSISFTDRDFIYRKGEIVYPKEPFDDHLLADASGIYFFLTRIEAELFEFHNDSLKDEVDEMDNLFNDRENDETGSANVEK